MTQVYLASILSSLASRDMEDGNLGSVWPSQVNAGTWSLSPSCGQGRCAGDHVTLTFSVFPRYRLRWGSAGSLSCGINHHVLHDGCPLS